MNKMNKIHQDYEKNQYQKGYELAKNISGTHLTYYDDECLVEVLFHASYLLDENLSLITKLLLKQYDSLIEEIKQIENKSDQQILLQLLLKQARSNHNNHIIKQCNHMLFLMSDSLKYYLSLRNEWNYTIDELEVMITNRMKKDRINDDYYMICILQGLLEASIEELFISNHIGWIDKTMVDVVILLLLILCIQKEIDYQPLLKYYIDTFDLDIVEIDYLYQNMKEIKVDDEMMIKNKVYALCEAIIKGRRRDLYSLLIPLLKIYDECFQEDLINIWQEKLKKQRILG